MARLTISAAALDDLGRLHPQRMRTARKDLQDAVGVDEVTAGSLRLVRVVWLDG